MDIHLDRLIYVVPAGLIACWLLDKWIWKKNRDWLRDHPHNPRHPYSPLFTAIGVVIVHTCSVFVIPWQYVLVDFGGFVIFGGLMWVLHSRRWWLRN